MTPDSGHGLRIVAPAKINLYLHVTRKRADGYHDLDSLVIFGDRGDEVIITPADKFSFSVEGPMAAALKKQTPNKENIVARAAEAFSAALGGDIEAHITLIKNLPPGAGLGGGSSDAAAAIRGLLRHRGMKAQDVPGLPHLLYTLGADVPACFENRPLRIVGTGEITHPAPALPELPMLLVWPGAPCATATVFSRFKGPFTPAAKMPAGFSSTDALIGFLKQQKNDLTAAAQSIVPAIAAALGELQQQESCLLARMSGSGSACFGIFSNQEAADRAAAAIGKKYPSWWVSALSSRHPPATPRL